MAQFNRALVAYMTLNDSCMNYDEFLWCFSHQVAIGWLLYHQNHPERSKFLTICQLTNPTVINYNIVKTSAIFLQKTTTKPSYFLFSFPKTPFFYYEKNKKTKNTHIPCPNKTILKSERKKSAYLTKHQINLITCFLAQIFIYLPKSNIDSLCFECLQRYWYDAYPTRFLFFFRSPCFCFIGGCCRCCSVCIFPCLSKHLLVHFVCFSRWRFCLNKIESCGFCWNECANAVAQKSKQLQTYHLIAYYCFAKRNLADIFSMFF